MSARVPARSSSKYMKSSSASCLRLPPRGLKASMYFEEASEASTSKTLLLVHARPSCVSFCSIQDRPCPFFFSPLLSPLRAICGGRGPGSNKPCLRSGRLTRTATTAWRCPLIHSGAGPKGHSSGRADAGATTRSSRHGLRRGPRRSPLRTVCGGRGRRGARGGCRTGCPGLARSQAAMACPSVCCGRTM